jgi:hypothetical protein
MKNFLGFIGLVLIFGVFMGGNLSNLLNWSSAEFVGGNAWTLFSLIVGGWLIYRALHANKDLKKDDLNNNVKS